jgi:hypothetical protein
MVEMVWRDTSAPYTSAQVRGHLPGREPFRRQRQDQLVDPRQAPSALADDLGLEAAVAVAGHVNPHRPDLGQHRLAAVAVAGVPAIAAHGVMLAVAEVVGQLAFQGGLDQPLGELGQQPTLPGQLQPAVAGLPDQPVQQLLVDRVQHVRPAGPRHGRRHAIAQRIEISHGLGHQVGHRCQSP